MFKTFKTMLFATAVLVAGIFANDEITNEPTPSGSSPNRTNHSTVVNAPSTPREENEKATRPGVARDVIETTSQSCNPEDGDCVVIES